LQKGTHGRLRGAGWLAAQLDQIGAAQRREQVGRELDFAAARSQRSTAS
jgi:hypothetical protein